MIFETASGLFDGSVDFGGDLMLLVNAFYKRLLICSLFAVLCVPVFADDQNMGDKMTIWIDVRTPEEYSQGHIQGSINIPYEIIGQEIHSVTRDVDSDIRVYCRSGRRSGVAMDTLKGMGYANVVNEGGYEDLLTRKAQGEAIP